jgi:hypothetical protein
VVDPARFEEMPEAGSVFSVVPVRRGARGAFDSVPACTLDERPNVDDSEVPICFGQVLGEPGGYVVRCRRFAAFEP